MEPEQTRPVPPVGRPFEPGQSGNPGGRPKRKPITEMLTLELEKLAARSSQAKGQKIVERLVSIALNGKRTDSIAAIRLIMSYTDGLPVQAVEVDLYDGLRRVAEERGLNPDRVIHLYEQLKRQERR
jgi:hypothetical protein